MSSIPLQWRDNLRAILALWPQVSPNISAVCLFHGKPCDEAEILKSLPAAQEKKNPENTRSVRNTLEVMSLAGLSYTDSNDIFQLTNLGLCLFSFMGVLGDKRYANDRNRYLLSDALIRGLGTVIEYRAIWTLMRAVGNKLSNEELNRAMTQIKYLEDVESCAEKIHKGRRDENPTVIGPRLYEDDKYATASASEQRKALNPIFLLAGGGRIFLDLNSAENFRRLEDWAIPLIDQQLSEPTPLIHASTEVSSVMTISDYAALPEYWGKI